MSSSFSTSQKLHERLTDVHSGQPFAFKRCELQTSAMSQSLLLHSAVQVTSHSAVQVMHVVSDALHVVSEAPHAHLTLHSSVQVLSLLLRFSSFLLNSYRMLSEEVFPFVHFHTYVATVAIFLHLGTIHLLSIE